MADRSLSDKNSQSLLPPRVRRWVMASVIALVLVAVILVAWRGPAILLDLAAMAWAWCF